MDNQMLEGFHLSPQQKHLWDLQQNNFVSRTQGVILLEGQLNIDILQIALETVVARHEILRTTFQRLPGITTPIQVINNSYSFNLITINLSNSNLEEFLQTERQLLDQPKENLNWRVTLAKLSENKHILVITLPALCADSWTIKNLLSEISKIYAGQELSDEPTQYIQFSEWQNELLEEEADAGLEYWQQLYQNNYSCPTLPDEARNIEKVKFIPHRYSVEIASAVIDKITALTNKNLAEFLLASWETLIWRLTKQSNIVINTVFDGRKYEELYEILGLVAKSLPVGCLLTKDLKFSEVLSQIQDTLQKHENWQEYFVGNEDINSRPISFAYAEFPAKYTAGDVTFSLYRQYVDLEPFKLKLNCWRRGDKLTVELHYDSNLFSAYNIQSLAGKLQKLLSSAANNPETKISELEILSDRDRHQLLLEWNNTQKDYPQDKCIHQLFEQQVEQTPHNIAVVFENQQLTYADLNAKANQLAHYLQGLGVVPETLVGLYVERGLDTIVALLGIVKAGAAYLPIDAALPTENIAIRLQEAQVAVLITQQSLVQKLPQTPASIVCSDTDAQIIAQESPLNLQTSVHPENLVYAIFTSGSTGKPKAVAVEHRQLTNYLYGIVDRLNLSTCVNFATISSLAADLGNTVIFPALCTGGCLHIISTECASDSQALAEYCQRHPIDCLKIVPSHLSALLASSSSQFILPRQCLILGGEASSWNLIEQIQQQTNCQIFNHYGPTETTVGVLTHPVSSKETSQTVPLGRPLANTQIYILDEQLQPVPIGVPGELYIGGTSVARGYLNQPELTDERFIKNSFSSEPTARLYKTGDIVRYLSNGNLEFLGRVDNQVKIRGFRVELGEIEAVLRQNSAVQEAIILTTEQELGNQRLVAYIVPNAKNRVVNQSQHSALMREIRSFCTQKLPEYMVPAAFVFLKALPLTANGKVDRQALPAPEQTRPELEQIYEAPRSPEEIKLAEIWAQLLGLEQVGINDNFFELGGHSLLVTQLLAKVKNVFQVELPLRDLFDAPTIADLAKRILKKQGVDVFISNNNNINLKAEAVLDPTIFPVNQYVEHQQKSIFLTGATGFLGASLLYELLQQTTTDIYCLVRADDAATAKERLQENLKFYLLWDESFSQRIIPIVGDLSQPLLGLSDEQFNWLAAQIDAVYHNGALVNFIYPYSALKAANVLGTTAVLRLAAQTQVKPVHFISTIAVAQQQDKLDAGENIASGYTESKWVAEQLIKIAGERGIPVSIYRPGRISGHSKTGVCNTDDHTFRMIRGCIQLKSVPKEEFMVNLIPVDYASQAIVHLSKQKTSLGKVFHLLNPNPLHWSELVNCIRSFGYPLRQISANEWRAELLAAVENNAKHPLYPLMALFDETESTSNHTNNNLNSQNTLVELAGNIVTCPPLDSNLLRTYFSYLIRDNLLPKPQVSEIDLLQKSLR